MNHSNAIVKILEAYRKDCQISEDYVEGGMHLSQEQTMQSLYEAAKGCVPEKMVLSGTQPRAYNACRRDVLTNLRELFGISKEGEQ